MYALLDVLVCYLLGLNALLILQPTQHIHTMYSNIRATTPLLSVMLNRTYNYVTQTCKYHVHACISQLWARRLSLNHVMAHRYLALGKGR